MGELSRFIPIEINDTDIIEPYLNSNQPDIIFAENTRHLIKEQRSATPKEMRDSSEFSNGATSAGALHTSASEDENSMLEGRITGIFRIPIKDFLSYANDGN